MNTAERYLARFNPPRTWAEAAARDGLTVYHEDLDEPMVDIQTAVPFQLTRPARRNLPPPPFAKVEPSPVIAVKPDRRIENNGDHLLMRVTSGWKVIRIGAALSALFFAGSVHAQELPPGCSDLPLEWVKGDTTPDQTGSFIAVPVPNLGLKWAVWKDGDQSLSINVMGGAYEGVMCMTNGPATDSVNLTCKVPGVTIMATKQPMGVVELMVCFDQPKPAPAPAGAKKAPAKPRVLPLPRATVRS